MTERICAIVRLGFGMSANLIGASNMALTLVDSDILIDVARGEAEAINCLLRLEQNSPLAISAVSQMELIVGCRNKKELQDLQKFPSLLPQKS